MGLPQVTFLTSKTYRFIAFLALRFFIPRCGSYVMLPYGVPFDSLSFLYLTSGHFFDFKTNRVYRLFWPSDFLSPGGGVSKGPLRVPNLRSFCFMLTGNICLGNFFDFKITLLGWHFF